MKRFTMQLNRTLASHLNTLHDTLQVLDQEPDYSLSRVSWNKVMEMGDLISKHATTVGMLWNGGTPEIKAVEENMAAYFTALQGFLYLSHGCRAGAGPTLSSSIRASTMRVVDCSFTLFKEAVSSYGSHHKNLKLSIPQLVGMVWDACSSLKKTPVTNITAIGRAMTRIAVSVKDVLREMKELKPDSLDHTAENVSDKACAKPESSYQDKDDSSEDLGNDLSLEEMRNARAAIRVVSDLLVVQKELIHAITGLMEREEDGDFVASLERLLKTCEEAGVQVDELGASLYPPQEVSVMKNVSGRIVSIMGEMRAEVMSLQVASELLLHAFDGLRGSVGELEWGLGGLAATDDIALGLQNVCVSD